MNNASINDILQKKANDPKESTGKIISKNLINDIISGNFKNINEQAKICNCSISTITKFVQSIGYVGYRELLFLMKIEHDHYMKKKFNNQRKSCDNSASFEYFTAVLQWISKNQNWVFDIASSIRDINEINIFTSHQTNRSAKFFYEVLITLGKRPIIINPSRQVQMFNKGDKTNTGVLNLFLISGRDNDTMFDFFLNRLDISSSKNFLVTTSMSSTKVDLKLFNSIIIDFEEDTPMFVYRDWLLHTLFLSIFEIYNESSFQ